jgi:hypothetical protein
MPFYVSGDIPDHFGDAMESGPSQASVVPSQIA